MKIALQIKELRESKGISQESLARSIACTQSYISAIENGTKMPSEKRAKVICDILKCKPSEFFKQTEFIKEVESLFSDRTKEEIESGFYFIKKIIL